MNTRRQVIRWVAAVFGTVAGLLPRFRNTALAQDSEDVEFEKVATLADLEDNLLLLEEGFSAGPVLLFQADPEDRETLVALNPTCPHRNCTVELEDGELVCPCHGSRFDTQGKVTRGPARADLPVYQVKIEDEDILLAPAEA